MVIKLIFMLLFRPMLVKYFTDFYNLDLCYKFNISEHKLKDTQQTHSVITLSFSGIGKNGNQDIISFSSVKDKDVYDQIVKYMLDNKIIESNNLGQFFE